jgi:hypothetical protein
MQDLAATVQTGLLCGWIRSVNCLIVDQGAQGKLKGSVARIDDMQEIYMEKVASN